MSNGAGQAIDGGPDRATNFFERTEQTYQHAADRVSSFANRLDNMSDKAGGHQPPQEGDAKASLAEKPSSFFDRCNLADRNLGASLDNLEASLCRLEGLGLF
jgi:hypothetical protein